MRLMLMNVVCLSYDLKVTSWTRVDRGDVQTRGQSGALTHSDPYNNRSNCTSEIHKLSVCKHCTMRLVTIRACDYLNANITVTLDSSQ
jgi:hypothetical protein